MRHGMGRETKEVVNARIRWLKERRQFDCPGGPRRVIATGRPRMPPEVAENNPDSRRNNALKRNTEVTKLRRAFYCLN